MKSLRWIGPLILLLGAALISSSAPEVKPTYIKKGSRAATVAACLKEIGLPNLEGKWFVIGPFDNTENRGFDTVYPPEKLIDLGKPLKGKGGRDVAWKELTPFRVGDVVDLKLFRESDDCVAYLFHEFESPEALELPVSMGSDDSLKVWFNGERVVAENVIRGAAPDQNRAALKLKPGKNQLLVKVGNAAGDWSFLIAPDVPPTWPGVVKNQLNRDFPLGGPGNANTTAEAVHYSLVSLPVPEGVVLEVGGLVVRPDGKLLACTRRGDVWLISNPNAEDLASVQFKRFAGGLHESLGLHVEGKDVWVVQRPELTRLIDRDGDDVVDEYRTVCDRWGVSGDYHEFAFGPARDRDGNFFVTLNVGFGGGHQSKAPWRGWCMKITPKGDMVPFATGLRSPNGVSVSPDNDLFYCDNQGEWVATNKMHHIREGDNFGHQAGLRWVKQSPFAGLLKESYPSGMLYDGQKGTAKEEGRPQLTPPCVWFPYGRMGQSVSEPRWDTTGGKFGPFAGQCFVGDQTKSTVMRVALEKVNGRYQGACFPFRSGFECGVNRLAFAPDGHLYAGMTSRGWGSLGGKPYGLQRLTWTGVMPFEVHAMKVTRGGFDLVFTKPLDPATAERVQGYALQSFTYNYWPTYGSPEVDHKAEKVTSVTLSPDRKTVSLGVTGLKQGRVYELHLEGVKSADGDAVLHPDAWYTLNELP